MLPSRWQLRYSVSFLGVRNPTCVILERISCYKDVNSLDIPGALKDIIDEFVGLDAASDLFNFRVVPDPISFCVVRLEL